MRYGWVAAAALFVAGCSSVVSGSGHALPVAAPAPAQRVSRPAPSRTPTASHTATPAATSAPAPVSSPTSPSTCAPVFFGVAGSGQGPQHPQPSTAPGGVSAADLQAYGTAVGLTKTLLVKLAGSRLAATQAIDYPASGVPNWVSVDVFTAQLEASEVAGTRALVRAIRAAEQGGCQGRPVLLAGYSQGAEVVIRAVDALSPQQRSGVAVALFGNPSYEPHVAGDYPTSVRGRGLRPSVTGSAFTLPADVRARTLDICAPGDPVCAMAPGATTASAKLTYLQRHAYIHAGAYAFGTAGYAKLAAQFLWRHR